MLIIPLKGFLTTVPKLPVYCEILGILGRIILRKRVSLWVKWTNIFCIFELFCYSYAQTKWPYRLPSQIIMDGNEVKLSQARKEYIVSNVLWRGCGRLAVPVGGLLYQWADFCTSGRIALPVGGLLYLWADCCTSGWIAVPVGGLLYQ
jgi:hypothetical protein